MRKQYESDKICLVERGLWTPELCQNKAENECQICSRAICKAHEKLSPITQQILCVSCFIKQEHEGEEMLIENPYTYQDPAWYYYERMRYKQAKNNIYFDMNDYDAFNYNNHNYTHIEEEYSPSFFDS